MFTAEISGRLLARALQAAEQWEDAPAGSPEERAAAETATGSIVALHNGLREGGELPAIWHLARPPGHGGPSSGAG